PASHLYAAGGDGKASDWPRGDWFKMVEGRPSAKSKGSARADRIVSIDFSGPATAIAKVECQLPPRYFTAYLTLLKVDGRWQITAKALHTVEKEEAAASNFIAGQSFASAATWTFTILSGGGATAPEPGAPRLILSTNSMPDTTRPHTVYWPSRKFESLNTMKNWLRALLGSLVRAIDTAPRLCGSLENSALSVSPMPPVPVPVGSPVWAMKPSMTRWNTTP